MTEKFRVRADNEKILDVGDGRLSEELEESDDVHKCAQHHQSPVALPECVVELRWLLAWYCVYSTFLAATDHLPHGEIHIEEAPFQNGVVGNVDIGMFIKLARAVCLHFYCLPMEVVYNMQGPLIVWEWMHTWVKGELQSDNVIKCYHVVATGVAPFSQNVEAPRHIIMRVVEDDMVNHSWHWYRVVPEGLRSEGRCDTSRSQIKV